MKSKIGCVVQGDLRRGSDIVLIELKKHFDVIILSSWERPSSFFVDDKIDLVVSNKPSNPGVTNRNMQRYSTASGLRRARELGCEYVLKWRTDMLPTNLDVHKLIKWANENPLPDRKSRIVTLAFRNLTVKPDWFSSIPDLFAFGHIDELEMLWGDEGFAYSRDMNVPAGLITECGDEWQCEVDASTVFGAETELYAIYKERLQRKFGVKLNHPSIVFDYFRLISHRELGICWFAKDGGYRSIVQAYEHAWWKESHWIKKRQPKVQLVGYKKNCVGTIKSKLSLPIMYFEKKLQDRYLKKYMDRLNRETK